MNGHAAIVVGIGVLAATFVVWLGEPLPRERVSVPNLIGTGVSVARLLAMREGLDTSFQWEKPPRDDVDGVVIAQDPPPGTRVWRRRTIALTLSYTDPPGPI